MTNQPDPILDGISITTTDRRRAAELLQSALAHDGNAYGDVLVELADAGMDRTMAVLSLFPTQMAVLLAASMGRGQAFNLAEWTTFEARWHEAEERDSDAPVA